MAGVGCAQVKMKNYDQARECFSRSASLRPHVVTYNAWAIMEEQLAQDLKVHTHTHSRGSSRLAGRHRAF